MPAATPEERATYAALSPEDKERVGSQMRSGVPPGEALREVASGGGLKSAYRGLEQGVTASFGDELAGLAAKAGHAFGNLTNGVDPSFQEDSSGSYVQGRDEARARLEASRGAHPYLTGAGQIAGSLVPFAGAAKGVQALRLAPKALARAAPLAQRAVQAGKAAILPGAVAGGVEGAGSNTNLRDLPIDIIKGELLGGAGGALLGPLGELVPAGAGAVARPVASGLGRAAEGGLRLAAKGVQQLPESGAISLGATLGGGPGALIGKALSPSIQEALGPMAGRMAGKLEGMAGKLALRRAPPAAPAPTAAPPAPDVLRFKVDTPASEIPGRMTPANVPLPARPVDLPGMTPEPVTIPPLVDAFGGHAGPPAPPQQVLALKEAAQATDDIAKVAAEAGIPETEVASKLQAARSSPDAPLMLADAPMKSAPMAPVTEAAPSRAPSPPPAQAPMQPQPKLRTRKPPSFKQELAIDRKDMARSRFDGLQPDQREAAVSKLVAKGLDKGAIAKELGVSQQTIDAYTAKAAGPRMAQPQARPDPKVLGANMQKMDLPQQMQIIQWMQSLDDPAYFQAVMGNANWSGQGAPTR